MKLRCRIGWHDWWPWSEPRLEIRAPIGSTVDPWRIAEAQVRACRDCGMSGHRTVGIIEKVQYQRDIPARMAEIQRYRAERREPHARK